MPSWGKQPEPEPEPPPAVRLAIGACPNPSKHYQTEVNKHSINMGRWEEKLNDRYKAGYRLAHVFEQDGNTVMVFEHHGH